MARRGRGAALLGEEDAADAAARAAAAAGGAAGEAREPAPPAATLRLSAPQVSALREALDQRAALRVAGAWPDAALEAAGAAVHAAVSSRLAPSVALIRAWIVKHWRAPEKPPPPARRCKAQTDLVAAAVSEGTYAPTMSDAQLQPLLDAVQAAGKKALTAPELRDLLRTLAAKQSKAAAGSAAPPPPPQPQAPTPEEFPSQLEAVEEEVMEHESAWWELLDLLEADEGGAASDEESVAERAARAALTAEHEAPARELLKRMRALHERYASLLTILPRLPAELQQNARERLQVVSGPLSDTVEGISTLVRVFEEAQAAAASAPTRRRKKRRHADKPAPEQVARFRKAAKARAQQDLARCAAWTGMDVLCFTRAPAQLHGTVFAQAGTGERLTDEQLQRVATLVESLFAERKAAAAAGTAPEEPAPRSDDE